MEENKTLIVQERIVLEDGKHEGVIVGIKFKDVKFPDKTTEYCEYKIECNENDNKTLLTSGYNSYVSKESKHGKMLMRFGVSLNTGERIDPNTLIGTVVEFMTLKKGKFANIITDSLKPKK